MSLLHYCKAFSSHPMCWLPVSATLWCCAVLAGCADTETPNETDLYVRVVDGEVFDTTPVYGEAKTLRLRRTGFEFKCSSCHTDFEHEITSNQPQGDHPEILARFDHGQTIYCLSCHHQSDRDSFVDNIGKPMPSDDSSQLCARCHGPIFRDWENGSHGRTNGHWSEAFGERTRLTCVQCHDPHSPAFPKMVPTPGIKSTRFNAIPDEKEAE